MNAEGSGNSIRIQVPGGGVSRYDRLSLGLRHFSARFSPIDLTYWTGLADHCASRDVAAAVEFPSMTPHRKVKGLI